MTNNLYHFYVASLISLLFLIIFFISSALGLIQSVESETLIGEASRWCERVSDGIFREPINTLSNLGFMVIGLYLFWILCNDDRNTKNAFIAINPISILYASVVIYLGPGSMLMHGTNTEWGAWADNLSMIMYIILPWLFNVYSMSKWTIKQFLITYTALVIIYSIWRWWIILFWLPAVLSNEKPKYSRTYKWFILGMISYLSAFAIWLTGVPDHESCSPDSIIQAHGIWHLLTALATYFFFIHFRTAKTV